MMNSCSTHDCRIERFDSIRAEHHEAGQSIPRQPINSPDQNIDSGSVLMMHLLGSSRLSERIGLIYDKNDCRRRLPRRIASLPR